MLTQKLASVVAVIAALIAVSASSTHAQAATIEITDPENGATFNDGATIRPKGKCSEKGVLVVIVITNYFPGGTHTANVVKTTNAQTGDWDFEGDFPLTGPGSWSVHVYIETQPNIYDNHNGSVNSP